MNWVILLHILFAFFYNKNIYTHILLKINFKAGSSFYEMYYIVILHYTLFITSVTYYHYYYTFTCHKDFYTSRKPV